jgi:hypothetical protein
MSKQRTLTSVSGQRQKNDSSSKCSVYGCERKARVRGWCAMHYQRWWSYGRLDLLTDADRFWAGVNKDGPEHPEWGKCWTWVKADRGHGYGVLSVNDKEVAAHRFAYTLLVGPIPEGLWVLHHCDNPTCVNPAHLFLGTNQVNAQDRVSKRRSAIGSRHGRSKLDPEKVRSIRRRLLLGGRENTIAVIARDFGVAPNAINNIKSGLAWAHVK